MGFFTGVITGVAISGAAAAWYLSRSGSKIREQYQLERRLGVLGDELEARTRDIQAQVNAQLAELRARNANGTVAGVLDSATAEAAETAAEVEADIDAAAAKTRKLRKTLDETAS